MSRPKDLNPPSRWNMRIWDDDKKEWLCQSDKDALTYYGFNITGGETTEFQGLPKWHPDRHLVWEQSTGLKDRNGIEVFEGDLVKYKDSIEVIIWRNEHAGFGVKWLECGVEDSISCGEVIGNIHEPPKDFRPEHLKRMGVSISKGQEE